MTFGGIKTYHLIFLDFSKNEYKVFKYEKDRRYTPKQAWNVIYEDINCIKSGKLSSGANIDVYNDLIKELSLNIKYCDRHMRFRS
jgi:hypothetical protein